MRSVFIARCILEIYRTCKYSVHTTIIAPGCAQCWHTDPYNRGIEFIWEICYLIREITRSVSKATQKFALLRESPFVASLREEDTLRSLARTFIEMVGLGSNFSTTCNSPLVHSLFDRKSTEITLTPISHLYKGKLRSDLWKLPYPYSEGQLYRSINQPIKCSVTKSRY